MRAVSAIIEAQIRSRCDARTSSGVSNQKELATMRNHSSKPRTIPLLEFAPDGKLKSQVIETLFDLGLKYCTQCQSIKPLSDFYKHHRSGTYKQCKACFLINSKQYYQDNREQKLEAQRAWREANKDHNRLYYEENKERVSAVRRIRDRNNRDERRDQYREQHRLWREKNPEKVKAGYHKRRTRKLNAEGSHTADDIKLLWEQQDGRCAYCDCELTPEYRHLDHVIPLSRGGSNWPSNLAWACPPCNLSKHDKLLEEWLNEQSIEF